MTEHSIPGLSLFQPELFACYPSSGVCHVHISDYQPKKNIIKCRSSILGVDCKHANSLTHKHQPDISLATEPGLQYCCRIFLPPL